VEAYSAALAAGPRDPQALVNRGISRVELGRTADALEDYLEALGMQPELRTGLRAAGIACVLLGRWDESRQHLEHALRLDPNDDEAWAALGDHHRLRQDFAAAVECYRRGSAALAARDAPPAARAGLLNKRLDALIALSDFGLARECAIELRATDPDFPYAAGLELFATTWTANWPALEPLRSEVVAGAGRGEPTALPWLLCSVTDDPWIQRRAADAFIARHHPDGDRLLPTAPKACERLRIGYLSPDFRDHPVGQLVAATFEGHDRTRFEVHAFSTHVSTPRSALRARLEAACDRFHDVALLDDQAIAQRIRSEGIDVLVDLAGHTTGGRPGIAARRPANIQVSFLGYPATYGGNIIDYLIADSYLVPAALEAAYGERIVRLPGSAVPPGDRRPATAITPDRPSLGLPNDALVLAAIHNTYKILPATFAAWMRLLEAHPRAVLWISRHDPAGELGLRAAVTGAGVDPARVVFADRVTGRDAYLSQLGVADLFLDTHPYNAHSSAADALWAGVPVVTCSGASFASRVCGGLLHALGLDALVTGSLADYEQTASELLAAPATLAELKSWLTTRGRDSTVFDPLAHTRSLEAAYEAMWIRAARGEAPASFTVAAPGSA
jgi:predicted O-linked N-acetylglucosamine transferase (SPINDLY family)